MIENPNYYGIVYKISFNRYNKLYIGQTIQKLRRRFQEHLRSPPNRYFESTLNKILKRHNKNKFFIIKIDQHKFSTKDGEIQIECIKFCSTPRELDDAETFFISKYKTYIRNYGTKYGLNVNLGGTGRNHLKGIFNPSYKHIDKNILIKMINQGYFLIEIAKELNISENTVNDKISEFWGDTGIHSLTEARGRFGGAEIAKTRYIRILRESSHKKEVERKSIVNAIQEGYFSKEIAEKLQISVGKLFNYLNLIGFSNLNEARQILGGFEKFKMREKLRQKECNIRGKIHPNYIYIDEDKLKKFIKMGLTVEDIAIKMKTSIWTIYNKINENWKMSYKEAKRLLKIYPKINNLILIELIDDGLGIKEIDAEFLKYLIKEGLELREIAVKYEKSRIPMSILIKKILKVRDFDEALNLYFWKPNLIDKLSLGLSATEIASELSKNVRTVRLKLKSLWKKDFEKLQNFSTLMRFLHNKYA